METSFPNEMESLAEQSGHLTPKLLLKELELLDRPEVPVYLFHMKPLHLDKISREVEEITEV